MSAYPFYSIIAVAYIRGAVVPATARGYDRMWDSWCIFVRNHALLDDPFLEYLDRRSKILSVVEFVRHLDKVEGRSSETINKYVASIGFTFRTHLRDSSFLEDELLMMARKATQKRGRLASVLQENVQKLPATFDMVIWIQDNYVRSSDIDKVMTGVACLFAFHFAKRVSEYVLTESDHAILISDVEFITANDIRLQAHQIREFGLSEISGVSFLIRSAKGDQRGKGNHLYLRKSSKIEERLLRVIACWCQISGTKPHDPVFSRYKNGRRKLLTREMVVSAVKAAAVAKGLNPDCFSSHSFRIGAATTMCAAGVDERVIQRIGGWKERSSVTSIYDRNTPFDHGALAVASDPNARVLSSKDVATLTRVKPVRSVHWGDLTVHASDK